MAGSPECGANMEAGGGGDANPESVPCTARFMLGLLLSGEAVTDEALDRLAGEPTPRLHDNRGKLVAAGLTCGPCPMRNMLWLNSAGGVACIGGVWGIPTMAETCVTTADGSEHTLSAGQVVMNRLQEPR